MSYFRDYRHDPYFHSARDFARHDPMALWSGLSLVALVVISFVIAGIFSPAIP
jgi:hypothetical protein